MSHGKWSHGKGSTRRPRTVTGQKGWDRYWADRKKWVKKVRRVLEDAATDLTDAQCFEVYQTFGTHCMDVYVLYEKERAAGEPHEAALRAGKGLLK